MTLESPGAHLGHVSVCTIVTGGECLISAWNLCSTWLPPFVQLAQEPNLLRFYNMLKVSPGPHRAGAAPPWPV